jgi:tetraacyldisaccharide 4'-kinase
MKVFRYILFPIALIYGGITLFRNFLYNKNIFKSSEFDIPIICIGNLSMGGTGKTPHTEYIARLLKEKFKIAILSRGYGRRTTNYIEADINSTAKHIGDEPAQYLRKFPNIKVVVEKKRVKGVLNLLYDNPSIEAILLDDAFQHRSLRAGLNILIADINKPFYNDLMLPMGELREFRKGKNRADIIIISKCPLNLSLERKNEIIKDISPTKNQKIFFSSIRYGRIYNPFTNKELTGEISTFETLVLTGIANPNPLYEELNRRAVTFSKKAYRDHYPFSEKDVATVSEIFGTFDSAKKIILTTEKDASRLLEIKGFEQLPIYCIEIEIDLIDGKEKFDNEILTYVNENKADSKLPKGTNEIST